jgi:hypothetical protein|tara:strand:+ start:198 stop:605 length:408 start_codon:yes stop_codon:yes gene_type:complete
MNESLDVNEGELNEFKSQLKQWLTIDEEINKHEAKIKELKKLKNKILQPQITTFMVNHNVKDVNTQIGKIRCNERRLKKPLNKTNIRSNLSQVIKDDKKIDQAMTLIMDNREVKTYHVLTKPKTKNISNTIDTTL